MKKKLCIFLFSIISLTAFGQVIPKGTRFIGGDFGFNYSKSNYGNSTSNSFQISLLPSITKFTKDNASITYSLGYGIGSDVSKSSTSNETYSSIAHTLSAGLYLRNYKMISEKLGISVQYGGNLSYKYSNFDLTTSRQIGLTINAGPGLIYQLNEKIAIEGTASLVNFHVGYSWSHLKTFNIGTGLSASPGLGIGFRYFLK